MNKLYFMNSGLFDVRAMLTFGVSAKGKEDAIGYFGTGFKYAVAIILRHAGSITIHSGGQSFSFTSRREEIRGKEFDIVLMNGAEAGFTTHLGANWQPWMAFRELYCNCMDEGGTVATSRESADTVIEVDCRPIQQAYEERALYFLQGEPMAENDEVQIVDKPSRFYFYRGVAVRELPYPACWSYNVKASVDLTEDRTAKYPHQLDYRIHRGVQNHLPPAMCRKLLTAAPQTFEGEIRFDKYWGANANFVDTARQLLASGIGVRDSARQILHSIDEQAGAWPEVKLTSVQAEMLNRSLSFLRQLGVHPDQFEIKVVDGLGDGVMGRAMDGQIFLSTIPFHMGTKQVASTLLEEWVHNKYGCEDFDRRMQSWLFDKVLSLGEELVGSPV